MSGLEQRDNSTAQDESWRGRSESPLPDVLTTAGLLLGTTLVSTLFDALGFSEASIVITYVLGVLFTALVTTRRAYCFIASAAGVLVFNFFFVSPRYSFEAWGKEYPSTFATMFVVAFVASTLAMRLRKQAEESKAMNRRTQILLETDQLLQECKTIDDVVDAMAGQLRRLFGRAIAFYSPVDGRCVGPRLFTTTDQDDVTFASDPDELSVAQWALDNNRRAGATTDVYGSAHCLYLAVRASDKVFGVVGIAIGTTPPAAPEKAVMLSIVGEAALAMERIRALQEREQAAVLAKNEQLRANLLRSISHDLRTPLTAISGNADIMLDKAATLDNETRTKLLTDIYDDAIWLNDMVENLLSTTRLEDGNVKPNMTCELVEEVIEEALSHVNRKACEHVITVRTNDDLLLARMDARLVMQVIDNIVNNAIVYTQKGSHIEIDSRRTGDMIEISISDDGPGIGDEDKPRIFDSFYTAGSGLPDGKRSVGLGLALCKTIVGLHGGQLSLSDNVPHGCVFSFTLPAEEVPSNACS